MFVATSAALGLVIVLGSAGNAAPPSNGGTVSITVGAGQIGVTQANTGANEGAGGFNINDITDVGFKNYRIYGGTGRYEPTDDGGAYGLPTIAEVKANPNIIDWATWDQQFNRPDGYFWSGYPSADVSTATILTSLKTAGVEPVIVLRPRDNNNIAPWIAPCITTTADQNEWWEHVFAMVYQTNVRNDYRVDRWEIGNEPNQRGQGWLDNGCTMDQYWAFARLTTDAIKYVYATYLPGRAPIIHAPGISGAPSRTTWATASVDNIDDLTDVFDYHWYSSNQDDIAAGYSDILRSHDTDGVVEPMWLSEWGTYNSTYNTVGAAIGYMKELYLQNLPTSYVAGSDVFSMYTWGAAEGLVADNGAKSETYYAFKTFLLGTQGGKPQYAVDGNSNSSLSVLASSDASGFFLTFLNTGSSAVAVTADVSAHRSSGVGTVTEYSSANKAVVIGDAVVSSGKLNVTVPPASVQSVRVP